MIIAWKIFLPNFWVHVPPPPYLLHLCITGALLTDLDRENIDLYTLRVERSIPHCFKFTLRASLYRLMDPHCGRLPAASCSQNCFGIRLSGMRITWPTHRSWAFSKNDSTPVMPQICSTSVLVTLSCQLTPAVFAWPSYLLTHLPCNPFIVCVYRKPAAWDPEIVRAVKGREQSAVLYTARPATLRANQVPYELKESRTNKSSSVATSSTGHNGNLLLQLLI